MTMYWHDQKVALEIVDDPSAQHAKSFLPSDWTVLEVTTAQVRDLGQFREIVDELGRLLGQEPIEKTPEWLAANERMFNKLMGNL